ncbi:unnamed protein product [Gongylonema pulchrum]|uniref:Immunoglobulin I-set domain protein n=1 Tax=Gongylonema pulchrum TaxID=637853 RepID=A0A183DPZ0_9BILA|nr:unnamed protein product [Gongylonema pulchrum]
METDRKQGVGRTSRINEMLEQSRIVVTLLPWERRHFHSNPHICITFDRNKTLSNTKRVIKLFDGVCFDQELASGKEARFTCATVSAPTMKYLNCSFAQDGMPVITEHPLDVIVAKGEPATLNCAAKGPDLQITWFKDGESVITNNEEKNSHRLVLHTGALFLLRAVIGNKAVLECSPPRGFPEPVVSWRKDERELRPQDEDGIVLHPGGSLIIEKVQRSDAGFYQCVATNMVGERVSNSARLSVFEKPYFLQKPQNITVEVGSSVLFDCRVSGDPMPSISWKKRNQQMPVGRAYIAADNRGLRIDNVHAAPSFTKTPLDITVDSGATAKFKCEAEGQPQPALFWSREGQQPSDEGEYICQAKNPAGSINTSAHLSVHAAPSFTKTPLDITVDSGATAKFKCEAEGQPQPALFWSREGQQELFFPGRISADGRIKVTPDGELTVADVRPADEGNYVCAAMNLAGSSLTKATLKVTSKSEASLKRI